MKIRCKKCGAIVVGDGRGTYLTCYCKSVAIDETAYYVRVIGNFEDYEQIKEESTEVKEESTEVKEDEEAYKLVRRSKVWK